MADSILLHVTAVGRFWSLKSLIGKDASPLSTSKWPGLSVQKPLGQWRNIQTHGLPTWLCD